MRMLSIAVAAVMLIPVAASAQNIDVIKERRAAFSEMGKAAKEPGKMLKGEIEFDAAKVKAALVLFQEKSGKLGALFPEDSKAGGDTKATKTDALPGIWDNKDDFTKRFDTLAEAAKAAETSITDEFAFQETFPKIVGNCGSCHKKYRKDDKCAACERA